MSRDTFDIFSVTPLGRVSVFNEKSLYGTIEVPVAVSTSFVERTILGEVVEFQSCTPAILT
jgi:hypothetical protein